MKISREENENEEYRRWIFRKRQRQREKEREKKMECIFEITTKAKKTKKNKKQENKNRMKYNMRDLHALRNDQFTVKGSLNSLSPAYWYANEAAWCVTGHYTCKQTIPRFSSDTNNNYYPILTFWSKSEATALDVINADLERFWEE